MKLSVAVLAALAGVNEAVVTCTGGKQLFEATCDSSGFKIIINEACRAEGFAGVDFPNAFMWGTQTVNKMAVPACAATPCVAADVVATSSASCSAVKPTVDATRTDSDSASTYSWLVPFNECEVVAAFDTNHWKYDLYFNSQSAVDTANSIVQMGQVKFTCKLEPFQEDGIGEVTIQEDDMVADADFKLDLRSLVQLTVSQAPDTLMITNTAATTYDGKTAMLSPMTAATAASTAKLGDHMELRLTNVSPNTALSTYSMSLYSCWASTTALATSDGTDTWTVGTTATANQFKFWDEFCPKYNWVAPESGATTGSGYLKTHWDQATSLHAINFRQFAFLDTAFVLGTGKIYYHCFVKVCPLTEEATCSTKKLDNTANTCTAPTYYDPSGRRRRQAEVSDAVTGESLVEFVAAGVGAAPVDTNNCDAFVDNVCITKKDSMGGSSSAKSIATATGLAAFMTLLNL